MPVPQGIPANRQDRRYPSAQICNQQVMGSSPFASSSGIPRVYGGFLFMGR
jgi:hypothetical protein